MRAVALAIVLAAGILAGCSLLPGLGGGTIDQQPIGVKVVVPQDQLRIEVLNQTTIPVVLVVNGTPRNMAPETSEDLGVADLGPLPWDMRMTTARGRELLHGTLHDGDVTQTNHGNGEGETTGFLVRADLSCGQLFIATHVASYGPAPGPSVPGDCD